MSAEAKFAYSQTADEQLDALEAGPNAELYNRLVDACEAILEEPAAARARSAVITTHEGLRFRTPVGGGFPYKVFWSLTNGRARIEAVFPYPV